jgi:hypothetical protein
MSSRSGRPSPVARKKKKGSDPFFYEMTITRVDFLRLLPVAVGNARWRIEGDEIIGEDGTAPWRIRLEEMPGRSFGPMELPVLGVTLDLDGTSESESAAFVGRFLLGFQRAGG